MLIEFPSEFKFKTLTGKYISCITHYSFTKKFDLTLRGGTETGYSFGSPCLFNEVKGVLEITLNEHLNDVNKHNTIVITGFDYTKDLSTPVIFEKVSHTNENGDIVAQLLDKTKITTKMAPCDYL